MVNTCFSLAHHFYNPSFEFFTSIFVGKISQESKWQQVSSDFHDSSQYYGRSQQCCCLDSLDSYTDFQLFLFKHLETGPNTPTTIATNFILTFHSFFFVLWQDLSICQSFRFLLFSFCLPEWQNSQEKFFVFFCWLALGLVFWPGFIIIIISFQHHL